MGLITQSGSCVAQNILGKKGDMMYTFRLESCSSVSLLHFLGVLPSNQDARHGANG